MCFLRYELNLYVLIRRNSVFKGLVLNEYGAKGLEGDKKFT
jgi:hypothetical protein